MKPKQREDARQRVSKRVPNETETEAIREDLRHRASQRIQNETEE